jgi:hypothetical protein
VRLFRIAIVLVVLALATAGIQAARHAIGMQDQPDLSKLPPVTEVSPIPTPAPSPGASPTPPPPLPAEFRLGVPFTTQAPLGDWAKHQESCEEANLIQVAAYWHGERESVIDPHSADRQIADLVSWQVQNWGSEDDLTDQRLGLLAQQYYGYQFEVAPITEDGIKRSIVGGTPVVLGVTTHGLGNPRYPNYSTHYLVPGYSVPHFITLVGYDSQGFILNDPGITPGHGYHVAYSRLLFAVDNLDQQHPNLDEGRVMLLIHL